MLVVTFQAIFIPLFFVITARLPNEVNPLPINL